jgi:hypothetical protein
MGYDMAKKLGQTGEDAAAQMGELAGQLQDDTAFKGYGVTTGLGTSTVNADGSTNLGVGQDEAAMANADAQYANATGSYGAAAAAAGAAGGNPAYDQAMAAMQGGMGGLSEQQGGMFGASQAAMNNAMQSTAGREQEIYDRTMAMQQPGLNQAKAAQQANEFAMGRGGMRGSQFGGTAEDAAMAKAQAGAQNQASFQAMGQAQQEQMQQANMANMFGQQGMAAAGMQGQLGGQMGQLGQGQAALGQSQAGLLNQIGNSQAALGQQQYQNSWMPMNQQMAMMQLGQGNAGMAQSGQFTGAGYAAQLGLGGMQAQINAEKAATELYGNMFGSIMNNAEGIGGGLEDLWNKFF